MSDPTGKILKDYEPVPSSLLGGVEVRIGSAPIPDYRPPDQGFYDQGQGSKQEDESSPTEGGSSSHHPWKVYLADTDAISWDVLGDPVWTGIDGNSINTLWFSDAETGEPGLTNVVGDVGYILLKIIREEESREATEVSLVFNKDVPESDYYNQYRVIAYVNSEADEPILQKQFEEIRIFEDLAVVNGEFQLVGLEMSHRNYYQPPLPTPPP
jgi:hypothetical protein